MPDDKLPGDGPDEKRPMPTDVEEIAEIDVLAEPPRTEGGPGMDPFAPPPAVPGEPKSGGQG